MESDDFLKATDEAVNRVFENDLELIGSDANERAIAHRFAVYLEPSFPGMNVDCEYVRTDEESSPEQIPGIEECNEGKEAGWIIPDVLVHARKSKGEVNLAVFEVKSCSGLDECDRLKLKGMTSRSGPLRYEFGMGVEFYPDHCDRLLFVDGDPQGDPIRTSPNTIQTGEGPTDAGEGAVSGTKTAIEQNADILLLDKAARKKIQGLAPEEALELYDSLKDKSITELTDSEYAERLVLSEKLSEIIRKRRKQKT